MKLKERVEQAFDSRLGKYKWYMSFKADYGFRTFIAAIGSSFINVVFAGVNAVTAIRYKSIWYGVFAAYYLILAVLRISVLLAYRHSKRMHVEGERFERAKWKIYLVNGATFVPLDMALAAAITVMMLMQKPTVTGEIMAITTATYTTYKVTMAVRNLVKARRMRDPVAQTLRNIGFIDALASLFSLEVTLITTFSDVATFEGMRPLTAISGFVVCAFTIGLGAFMIIRAAKKLHIGENIQNLGASENGQ